MRDSLPEPVLLDSALDTRTGEESAFYLKMGLNCETFGFYGSAILYYDAGLAQSDLRQDTFGDLARRRSWCYTVLGAREAAVQSLQDAADAARWPGMKQRLAAEARRLQRGR
jgi:hypothetical protein